MSRSETRVPLDLLFRRLAGEMRQLEQDGLKLEGWISGALQERNEAMPPVSAALQNLDRLLQTLGELGLLFEGLAVEIREAPVLDLENAIGQVRLRDLTIALVGGSSVEGAAASGEVDFF
ncbi:hypothetical protein OCH239_01940 [Roseivivax halodurans JCM 10272]|uniref:Uncharacterized protein n=1 Tax=Roseivivax halodurans JCM 10272 TaxID=1449350 RepID=X7ELF0_9RHOB|nr:hypothetical protein [Roseivivax halodurans]ETX16735.1 hypothetical protein OCH239_01940 [Roseivivax halodurans JCM 10272]